MKNLNLNKTIRRMSDVKYTKKASARIIKEVQKFNPKIPLTTTFDQAFVLLMTEWDLEMGIETYNGITTCSIYRDGTVVHTIELKNVWDDKTGDWDWNTIYRTVLEHIIKTRMYKRPKVSKRELNRIAKEKAEAEKKAAKVAAKKAKEDAKLAKLAKTAKKTNVKKTTPKKRSLK
jgi:hypothetical protein